MRLFIHCRFTTEKRVTLPFREKKKEEKKAFCNLLYKYHVSFVRILPNVSLINWFSEWSWTNGSPLLRNEWAGQNAGSGKKKKSFAFSQKYLMEFGRIQWNMPLRTCGRGRRDALAKLNVQKPAFKLQLLVFALTIVHVAFSTKARHFGVVRGRYVLKKVKRQDFLQNKKEKKSL